MKKFLFVVIAAMPLSLIFAPAAQAAPRQPEHLTITIDPTAPPGTPSPLTATGPISGTGTDTQTSGRSAGRTDHNTELLTFADGTVTVKDSGVGTGSFDASTCTQQFTEKGVW